MSDAVVRIRGLSKSYTHQRSSPAAAGSGSSGLPAYVLDGIDLEIHPGEIFGLLGANGAGKTTLVEILSTQLLPTAGQATICGHDVTREPNAVRRLVGYSPASADSFFPRLSVAANLEFFATLYGLEAAQARLRIADLLTLLGLQDLRDRIFQKLSLGMKQRLGLARALLADPPVLLLDEPTRSLDPAMQREMHRFLRENLRTRQGKSILLVTHNFQEVEAICDRVAILSRGKIAACGTPREIVVSAGASGLAGAYELFAGHHIDVSEMAVEPDRGMAS